MQENETQSFSHPPTMAELMGVYAAENNDPRSPFYKRVLVRPKISVVRILIWILSSLVVCVGAAVALRMVSGRIWPAILGFIGVLILIGLIFAKRILITMVKIYQAVAPESVRQCCRYEPSCSVYMIQAVEKYGFWKGLRKGLRRWRSCKPPNGGFDSP